MRKWDGRNPNNRNCILHGLWSIEGVLWTGLGVPGHTKGETSSQGRFPGPAWARCGECGSRTAVTPHVLLPNNLSLAERMTGVFFVLYKKYKLFFFNPGSPRRPIKTYGYTFSQLVLNLIRLQANPIHVHAGHVLPGDASPLLPSPLPFPCALSEEWSIDRRCQPRVVVSQFEHCR